MLSCLVIFFKLASTGGHGWHGWTPVLQEASDSATLNLQPR